MVNRISFLIALAGMLLSVHLWIQKSRNFDRGCWGIGPAAIQQEAAGCQDPALRRFDTTFGVPTAALALVTFTFLATMSFAAAALPARAAATCHRASKLVSVAATVYAGALAAFQIFVVKSYCPLCLVIAALILSGLVLHFWPARARAAPEAEQTEITPNFVFYGGTAFIAQALLVCLVVGGVAGSPGVAARRRLPPRFSPAEWALPPSFGIGTSGGHSLVAFLDPNCPHCNRAFKTINELSKKYSGTARFWIVPRMLWPKSQLQLEALQVAAKEGRYFEMWETQFNRKKLAGMTLEDVKASFTSLGLSTDDIEARLEAERADVLRFRDRAAATSINATPSIFIDGAMIRPDDLNTEKVTKMLTAPVAQPKNPEKRLLKEAA
jgi:uncharacterized membrane protein/thiol-disulfide isomerase/thioredoxin